VDDQGFKSRKGQEFFFSQKVRPIQPPRCWTLTSH